MTGLEQQIGELTAQVRALNENLRAAERRWDERQDKQDGRMNVHSTRLRDLETANAKHRGWGAAVLTIVGLLGLDRLFPHLKNLL